MQEKLYTDNLDLAVGFVVSYKKIDTKFALTLWTML